MIKALLRLILGTLTVTVYGNTERFFEKLSCASVVFWDVTRLPDGGLRLTVYRTSYKKLCYASDKTHVRLEITDKYGLPYALRGYRKRFGILIGAVIAVALFCISSLFVWRIEVYGCETVSKQEVLTRLSDLGVDIGCLKGSISAKHVENNFLKNYPKMSWISINLLGTTAYVEVREKPETPHLIDSSEPTNIYAARDGVICEIHSYMGYETVSVGDTVTAGDLLVTGNYTDKYGTEYKLHSYATVRANTVHTHKVTVPYQSTEHIRTGKLKNKYSLKLIRFDIPLYFNKKIIYNNYDITKSEKQLVLGKSLALPITLEKTTYTEVEKCTVTKSKDVALKDAYEMLYDYEYNLVGIDITDKKYEEYADENGVTVKVILECVEDIGITKKID